MHAYKRADAISTVNGESPLRVSVAICTCNGGQYLEEQLESILQQEQPVWELVVSDDGSIDSTIEIIKNFRARAPFPVVLARNEQRLGSTQNFEQAIRLCTGDLIALADQDDIWLPGKTREMVLSLENEPSAGGVFSDAFLIDKDSRPTGETLWGRFGITERERRELASKEYASVLLRRPIITGATFMFRASLRERVLPIPSPWIHDAWLSWSIALQSSLIYLDKPLMSYRTHASQQIGVPPRKREALRSAQRLLLHGTSVTTRTRVIAEYQNQVLELMQLTELTRSLDGDTPQTADRMKQKASFCAGVLSRLGKPRLSRIWPSMMNIPNYWRFHALGLRALVRDVLL